MAEYEIHEQKNLRNGTEVLGSARAAPSITISGPKPKWNRAHCVAATAAWRACVPVQALGFPRIAPGDRRRILLSSDRSIAMGFGVRALGILAILAATALPARAQVPSGFPAKPVRFVVPFPGGGVNDVLARIAADKLTAKWGQPIVVENRTGAGGNIGADFAAQAEPDGHTLFIAPPGPLAINQSLYRALSYRPEDFVPVTVLAAVTNLIIVRPEIGVNSVTELIAFAKRSPGEVTYGSQGNGSTPHLTGSMFMTMTGVRMIHVPYRGENLVINDMLGGHVDVFFGNIAPVLPHYRDGKLKILAVA